MNREEIHALVLDLPEVKAWPDLTRAFTEAVTHPRQDWELPLIACRAVGGDNSVVAPAAASLVCVQLSITLVDDILDHDPRGLHNQIGEGATANLALALQAIGFHLIGRLAVDAERRGLVTSSLAQLALATAFGQSLDVQNLSGEENYWRMVKAKSTPFYGESLYIGAVLGQASTDLAGSIRELGNLVGEMIQINDDLTDAFQKPANPDWNRGWNNLAILYASTANHPERERFLELRSQAGNPETLQAAQQILIRSGAVSYCAYQVARRYKRSKQMVERMPLADPLLLENVLAPQIEPLRELLTRVGAAIPPELG